MLNFQEGCSYSLGNSGDSTVVVSAGFQVLWGNEIDGGADSENCDQETEEVQTQSTTAETTTTEPFEKVTQQCSVLNFTAYSIPDMSKVEEWYEFSFRRHGDDASACCFVVDRYDIYGDDSFLLLIIDPSLLIQIFQNLIPYNLQRPSDMKIVTVTSITIRRT